MPNLTPVRQGIAQGTLAINFSTARESDSASHSDSSTSSNSTVVEFFRDSGKGSTNYRFKRYFLCFDFSSYTSGTISNLVFNYRATTSTSGNLIEYRVAILKFDGMGSGPTFTAYQDDEFFDDIDYSTAYTAVTGTIPQWTDANSDATVSLNSTAITDAQNNGQLKMAIVQYENDYNGSDSASDRNYNYRINFNTGASGFVPFLSFNFVAGYGNDVIGVSSANISEINDIATADISQVIGV